MFGSWTGWWEPRTAILWTGMALAELMAVMSDKAPQASKFVPLALLVTLSGVWLRTHLMLAGSETPVLPLLVWRSIITSLTLPAFCWTCYFGPAWWKNLLAASHLRRLGAASYSCYLTHGFVVKLFKFGVLPLFGSAAGTAAVFWGSQMAGVALTALAAVAVYQLVEEPLVRLALRRHLKGGREASVANLVRAVSATRLGLLRP